MAGSALAEGYGAAKLLGGEVEVWVLGRPVDVVDAR